MPEIFFLHPKIPYFPSIEDIETNDDIICIGGEITTQWLLAAYEKGYFPWFNPNDPVMWWFPNPRAIMKPQQIRIHKSMRPYLNQVKFHLRIDYAFDKVIRMAQQTHKKKDNETWISQDFIREYTHLHKMGYAHSFEAWKDGQIVGGLYGVSLGRMFFGETMFSIEKNASKFCFIALAKILQHNGFNYIDCQIPNDHLTFMGCSLMPRKQFLAEMQKNQHYNTLKGNWAELMDIPPSLQRHFIP